jgi:hypothetical protein
MIKYILSLISRVFFIYPDPKETKETGKKNYLCQLSFCLNDTKEIDIYCQLPDLKPGDIKSLHNDSMVVAEFLHIIHSGKLQKQTLSLIQEETEYNAEEKLFFDNIVFYLTLLDKESKKSNKNSSTEPLVRPSRVFNK